MGERVSDPSVPQLHPGDTVSHAVDVTVAMDEGRFSVADPETAVLVGHLMRRDLRRVRALVTRAGRERLASLRPPQRRNA